MQQVWASLGQWMAGHFPPPEDGEPIDIWAGREVLLSQVTAESGRPDFAGRRHQVVPLRRFQDSTTREINLCAPVRSGKNVVTECMMYWAINQRPAPWLQVMQTAPMARDFMLQRIWPALDRMEWFDKWQPDYHVSRPVNKGVFGNGMSWRFTGPAKTQLQSFGACYAVIDEVWQQKVGIIDEVKGRLVDFKRSGRDKLVCISQAGGMECDDWRTQFNSGTLFEWWGPCNSCGELMPLKWTGLREDRSRWGVVYKTELDSSGLRNIEVAQKTVRYECKHCGHQHKDSERTRRKWVNKGAYVHQAKDGSLVMEDGWVGDKISLRFPDLLTAPLPEMVGDWVTALNELDLSGSIGKRSTFILKRLAEWEDEVQDNSLTIEVADEGVSVVEGVPTWDERVACVLTVDCQIDHYWYWVEAANKAGATMVLECGTAYTLPEIEEVKERHNIAIKMVGVDVSDNRPKRAREIAPFGKFNGSKFLSWWGMSGRSMPRGWPDGKGSRVFTSLDKINPAYGMTDKVRRKLYAKRGVPIINFAADQYKDETWSRYKSGNMQFHPSLDTSVVAQHFAGEHKVTERGVTKWKQVGKRPNHLLDTANMATVLLSMGGYVKLGEIR